MQKYTAAVVGAGPAGLAVVGNLLAQRVQRVLWADPLFEAGRVNAKYREVPSNTRVALFLQYAEALQPFKDIIEQTTKPNAIERLRQLKQDECCSLSNAADMCKMLTQGLSRDDRVTQAQSRVAKADFSNSKWNITLNFTKDSTPSTGTADLLVLCSGGSPVSLPLPPHASSVQEIPLDTVLKPSALRTHLSPNEPATVGVVGTSHSAVLALLNLYNLAQSSHQKLHILWFARSPLLYAEHRDGWILRDNTGLKGDAAKWAKAYLEDDKLPAVRDRITKISLAPRESFTDHPQLTECSHLVQAVGYRKNSLPEVSVNGVPAELQWDPIQGTFRDRRSANLLPGLHGAGIAFPELVTDPEGNVESAVGMFKFMRFLKRVVPEWTAGVVSSS